jgi:hypothetical protein
MKAIFSATLLAVGLVLTGASFAAANTSSAGTDPGAVIEHHSTTHSIGSASRPHCPHCPMRPVARPASVGGC